jgi:hypothetical protein
MIKILIILSLFSVSLFAQNEEETEKERILREYSKKEKNNDELEQSIRDTVEDLQVISPINQNKYASDESVYKPRELKDSYLTGIMDSMMKEMLASFLRENPMSKMTDGEVRSLVEAQLNNLPIGSFFQDNPKFLDFFVAWLRDKKALPRFVSIVNEPEKLKTYGIIVMCVLVASFFLNLFNSKGNLFKRILRKIMIIVGVGCINLGVFYFMFTANLKPTLDLAFKYIWS